MSCYGGGTGFSFSIRKPMKKVGRTGFFAGPILAPLPYVRHLWRNKDNFQSGVSNKNVSGYVLFFSAVFALHCGKCSLQPVYLCGTWLSVHSTNLSPLLFCLHLGIYLFGAGVRPHPTLVATFLTWKDDEKHRCDRILYRARKKERTDRHQMNLSSL